MAIQARSILRNWFKNGDKPTQAQFADWIDSFVHKNEDTFSVTVEAVQGLNGVLSEFASLNALNAHISDTDAHGAFLIDGSKTMTGDIKLSDGLGLKWGAAGFGQSVDTAGFKFKASTGFQFDIKSNLLTTDRVYTFQDASYILAGNNIDNYFSTRQTFNNTVALLGKSSVGSGKIQFAAFGNTITGVDTAFLTELSVGDTIFGLTSGGLVVTAIASNTQLTVAGNSNPTSLVDYSFSKPIITNGSVFNVDGSGALAIGLARVRASGYSIDSSRGISVPFITSHTGILSLGGLAQTGIVTINNVSATVTGALFVTGSSVLTGRLAVNNSDGSNIASIFRGSGSGGSYTQTTDLTQWQSWSGAISTMLSKIDKDGKAFFPVLNVLDADAVTWKIGIDSPVTNVVRVGKDFTTAYLPPNISLPGKTGTDVAGDSYTISSGAGRGAGGESLIKFVTPTILASGSTEQPLAVRMQVGAWLGNANGGFCALWLGNGAATGANYSLLYGSSALAINHTSNLEFRIGASGPAIFTVTGFTTTFGGRAEGYVPVTVKAHVTQAVDLTRWNNSSNTILAKIDKDAKAYFPTLSVTDPADSNTYKEAVKGVNTALGFSILGIGDGFTTTRIKNILFASADPGVLGVGTFCFFVEGGNLKVKNASGTVVTII